MTLDDCDLPEVRALLGQAHLLHEGICYFRTIQTRAALAALYEKWQEAEGRVKRLNEYVRELAERLGYDLSSMPEGAEITRLNIREGDHDP